MEKEPHPAPETVALSEPPTAPHGSEPAREPTPLHVAIVGRSMLGRHGLALVLADCAREAITCREYEDLAELAASPVGRQSAHVVVLLGRCDDSEALWMLDSLAGTDRAPPVVVYCQCCAPDMAMLRPFIDRGARGLILPTMKPWTVLAVIQLIAEGGIYLPPPLADWLPWTDRRPQQQGRGHHSTRRLSDRESTVLALLGQSLSNAEIASRLGISEGTVKVHLRNLRRKTHAQSRVALALMATREQPRRQLGPSSDAAVAGIDSP